MDINVFWFSIVGLLLSGYAMLDGFDLGVGIVHFTARTDTERRIFLNSIGPLWDGNEVWLVTFGGAVSWVGGTLQGPGTFTVAPGVTLAATTGNGRAIVDTTLTNR